MEIRFIYYVMGLQCIHGTKHIRINHGQQLNSESHIILGTYIRSGDIFQNGEILEQRHDGRKIEKYIEQKFCNCEMTTFLLK